MSDFPWFLLPWQLSGGGFCGDAQSCTDFIFNRKRSSPGCCWEILEAADSPKQHSKPNLENRVIWKVLNPSDAGVAAWEAAHLS